MEYYIPDIYNKYFDVNVIKNPDNITSLLRISSNKNTPIRLKHRLKNEYEITNSLQILGISKAIDFYETEGISCLTLQQLPGVPLIEYFRHNDVSLKDLLSILVDIVRIVGEIHSHDIIHKNLNSNSIWVNTTNKKVLITDFGIASKKTTEHNLIRESEFIEGNIYFIAPEQTQRINRIIDFRVDHYSLGVVFYEVFTGRVPFDSVDLLEVIHAHLAKKAVIPGRLIRPLPFVLKNIILKLLSKNPEDRYFSMVGIEFDLKKCYNKLVKHGKIPPFKIAEYDFSGRLNISKKLFGRDSDIQKLNLVYKETCQGLSNLLLVSGYSGVGKSSLVEELKHTISQGNGFFITGKFDQQHQIQPYSVFIMAITELVNKILSGTPKQLFYWKKNILNGIGSIGQVLINVIPALKFVIDEQPALPNLEGQQSKNRFAYAFKSFFKTIAKAEHPLIFFIDDLQWCDSESLDLLEAIMLDPEIHHLLVICTYRSNEVTPTHKAMIKIESLTKAGIQMHSIEIDNLKKDDIREFLDDALYPFTSTNHEEFISILFEKTLGNPFYMKEYLNYLRKNSLITFCQRLGENEVHCKWEINLQKIKKTGTGLNIIYLIQKNINSLPNAIREIILAASCIGAKFSVEILSFLCHMDEDNIIELLQLAIEKDIILPIHVPSNKNETFMPRGFMFAHDGLEKASYNLLSKKKKENIHYQIGTYHLHKYNDGTDVNIFDIVNHLNLSTRLVKESNTTIDLIRLNIAAAIKSKKSAAYFKAFSLINKAIFFSSFNIWKTDYSLAILLYSEASDAAFQIGKFDKMHEWIKLVLSLSKSISDCENVYLTKINHLNATNESEQTISVGLGVLKQLGVRLPIAPSKSKLISEYIKTRVMLLLKSKEQLLAMPKMTSNSSLFISRILSTMASAAYMAAPELAALISFKFIQLTLKYGHTEYTPYNFAGFGLILCAYAHNIKKGYEFGELALQLLDVINEKSSYSRTQVVVYAFLSHWKQDLKYIIKPLHRAHTIGLETGDHEFATSALGMMNYYAYFSGVPLQELNLQIGKHLIIVRQLKQSISIHWHQILHQTIENMMGQNDDPVKLIGRSYDENIMLPIHKNAGNKSVLFTFHFNKAVLALLFESYGDAVKHLTAADIYREALASSHFVPIYLMYSALIYFHETEVSKKKKKENKRKISNNLKQLKTMSLIAPQNIESKMLIVNALLAILNGNLERALNYCEQSIELSEKNSRIQEKALCQELSVSICERLGKNSLKKYFAIETIKSFTNWGATAKVKQLKNKFLDFIDNTSLSNHVDLPLSSIKNLDRDSLSKAAMAISREISLDNLVRKIMEIVLENAGAERAFFILKNNKDLIIKAKISDENNAKYNLSTSLEEESRISKSIVHYTNRTGKAIILNNAMDDSQFSSDSYIQRFQPKSIMSIPITHKEKTMAILYLENNMIAGAFMRHHEHLIDLLSGQVAISIENAQLYERLDENLKNQVELIKKQQKFISNEVLLALGYQSILEVKLGDMVEKEVTIFFSDIRSFTTISEQLTPEETFNYLNEYYKEIGPIIQSNMGFVSQYYGDGIMALFMRDPSDAIDSAIQIQHRIKSMNKNSVTFSDCPIQIGIGIHTGTLMMGLLGDKAHMNPSVVSDAVNTTSRIEGLTKIFNASIIISQSTIDKLNQPNDYNHRFLGTVKLKGKQSEIGVFEVFDGLSEIMNNETKAKFEDALKLYSDKLFEAASILFKEILSDYSEDVVTIRYYEKCIKYIEEGVSLNWSATEIMEKK